MSSSGHMVLLGSRDKALEVFLHAGTAAALLVALRSEVADVAGHLDRDRIGRIVLTLAPAALAGLLGERAIERRMGRRAVGAAQLLGGLALLAADRAPQRRSRADAGPRDALLIGAAQACALVPGISRNGATLTAARALGFRRDAASRLSRHAALPVIAGATALKLLRLRGAAAQPVYVAGFAAAFASSAATSRLVPAIDSMRSHAPFALYRIALGLLVLTRPAPPPADGLEWTP